MARDDEKLRMVVEVLRAREGKRQLEEVERAADDMSEGQRRAAEETVNANDQASRSILNMMEKYGQMNQTLEVFNRVMGIGVAVVEAFTSAIEMMGERSVLLQHNLDEVGSSVNELTQDFTSGFMAGGLFNTQLEEVNRALGEGRTAAGLLGRAFDFVAGSATHAATQVGALVAATAAFGVTAVSGGDPFARFREVLESHMRAGGGGTAEEGVSAHRRLMSRLGGGGLRAGVEGANIEDQPEFRTARQTGAGGMSLPGVGDSPYGLVPVDPYEDALETNRQATEVAAQALEIANDRGRIMREHAEVTVAIAQEAANLGLAEKQRLASAGGGGGGGGDDAQDALFNAIIDSQNAIVTGNEVVAESERDIAEFRAVAAEQLEEFWSDHHSAELDRMNERIDRRTDEFRFQAQWLDDLKQMEERLDEARVTRINGIQSDIGSYAAAITKVGNSFASVFDHLAAAEEEGSEEAKRWGKVKGGILAAVAFIQSAIEWAAAIGSASNYDFVAAAGHAASAIAYDVAGALALAELGGSASSASHSGSASYVPERPESAGTEGTGPGTTIVIQTYGMDSARHTQHMNDATRRLHRSGVEAPMQAAGGYR